MRWNENSPSVTVEITVRDQFSLLITTAYTQLYEVALQVHDTCSAQTKNPETNLDFSSSFSGYSSQKQCIHAYIWSRSTPQLITPSLSSVKLLTFKAHDLPSYTLSIVFTPSVFIKQKAGWSIAEACNVSSHW